jgi:hypothetical protein
VNDRSVLSGSEAVQGRKYSNSAFTDLLAPHREIETFLGKEILMASQLNDFSSLDRKSVV